MASLIFLSASSRVLPWLTQPGIDGRSAMHIRDDYSANSRVSRSPIPIEVRFGESPKPTRESRVLPRFYFFEFFGGSSRMTVFRR